MHKGKEHSEHHGHHKHDVHAHVKSHSMKHHRLARKHGGMTEHDPEGHFDKDPAPHEVYAGAGSHVVKEAEAKKRGGRAKKHLGHVHGHHAHKRHDRPARKHGGRAASDMNPFSSAHKGTEPKAHKSYEPERD